MSDTCLLDTNVVSALWDSLDSNHVQTRDVIFRDRQSDYMCVSPITLAEIEFGLHLNTAVNERRRQEVRRCMRQSDFAVVPVDERVCRWYGRFKGRLFNRYAPRDKRNRIRSKWLSDLRDASSGKELGVEENDLWQVSTAATYDLLFITYDRMRRIRAELSAFVRIEILSG